MKSATISRPVILLCGFLLAHAVSAIAQEPPPQQSTSGPFPPPNAGVKKTLFATPAAVTRTITGVPDYLWRHGCGPTAVGMVVGYYQTHGYPDLIPGDAATQTTNVDQAIASQGSGTRGSGLQLHYEDYCQPMDSSSPSVIPDSSTNYPVGCHTDDSIADFMHTSWSKDGNKYGWSWSSRVSPSFTGYVNLKNPSYAPQCTSYSMGESLWAALTNEIDHNRPMVFLVDSGGDGATDHFVTIVGYTEDTTRQYGCLDTWSPPGIRWCEFRSMSTNYSWGVWGGWSFRLTPSLGAQPLSQDFGSLQVGSTAERTFVVTNSGIDPVSGTATVATPFSIVSGGAYTLNAGQTQAVVVRYQPLASGINTQTVLFTGGGGVSRPVTGMAYTSSAPGIVTHPQGAWVLRGSNVTFSAAALGALPFSYQWQFYETNLVRQTNATLTLSNVQFAQAGRYRLVVTNAFGTATSSNATLTVSLPFDEALDTVGWNWSTADPGRWIGQTQIKHDGVDAAQSGPISHNQVSMLQATVTGPGTLAFWWKASSESGADVLRFYVNGVAQAAVSGEVDWQRQTIYLGSGSMALAWRYSKDASGTAGQDAGWVDQVSFAPGTTPAGITIQPADQSRLGGETASFSVTAIGTPPLAYQWQKNGTNLLKATRPTLTLTNLCRLDCGAYAVVVTNSFGSVISSNALLTVRVPQRLRLSASGSDGLNLCFGDADGGLLTPADAAGFEVQESTNLVAWLAVTNSLTLTNGQLRLDIPAAANPPARFYRVLER